MAQKLKTLIIATTAALSFGGFFFPVQGSAATSAPALKASDCPAGVSATGPTAGQVCKKLPSDCPSGLIDPNDDSKCAPIGNGCTKKIGICTNNPIVKDLNVIVDVLSGLVGVVVVGTIILGGVQYAMAGDKAEAVGAAKQRIINGIIALLAFLFIFAFLQWLIPGGVFG